MQMYSVSARNLYRISPWYRLKPPLYLIFRKTDRTGQGCPCPCWCQFYHPTPLKDAGWSRTVPAPPLTDWSNQHFIEVTELQSTTLVFASNLPPARSEEHQKIFSAGRGWEGYFLGDQGGAGWLLDVFVLHPAECWCRTTNTTHTNSVVASTFN